MLIIAQLVSVTAATRDEFQLTGSDAVISHAVNCCAFVFFPAVCFSWEPPVMAQRALHEIEAISRSMLAPNASTNVGKVALTK